MSSALMSRGNLDGRSHTLGDGNSYNDYELVRKMSAISVSNTYNNMDTRNPITDMKNYETQFQPLRHSTSNGFLSDVSDFGSPAFLPSDDLYSNNQYIDTPKNPLDDLIGGGPSSANRKSANMTEAVPVPSSEHVAEIVGRQGCKIKSLRTQTNTYIKTPVRGAEPVFVVTGRKEDVAQAKSQILSAAEHFSSIRAKRSGSGSNGSCGASMMEAGPGYASPCSISTPMPADHTTISVEVPMKVVGLVVGPKGATIKRIQQATSTYIVTPGRDKHPIFEVTGTLENVRKAEREIVAHIANRTGNDNNKDMQIDEFEPYNLESNTNDKMSDSKSHGCSHMNDYNNKNNIMNGHDNLPNSMFHQMQQVSGPFKQHPSPLIHHPIPNDFSMLPNNGYNHFHSTNSIGNAFKVTPGSGFPSDEGIAKTGSTASVYDPNSLWGDSSFGVQRSNSISVPGPRILPPGEDGPHPRTRRTNSDPLAAAFQRIDIATFSSSSGRSSQGSTSPVTGRSSHAAQPQSPRNCCVICHRAQSNASLMPCHHDVFCMRCAEDMYKRDGERCHCPICNTLVQQVVLSR